MSSELLEAMARIARERGLSDELTDALKGNVSLVEMLSRPLTPRAGTIVVHGNPARFSTFNWVEEPTSESFEEGSSLVTRMTWTMERRVIYYPPMTTINPLPDGIETREDLPDSEELADTYERRALAMEQEAADARTAAQAEGHRLGASSFRRKAAAMRERMG